jgi:hypothetical protein
MCTLYDNNKAVKAGVYEADVNSNVNIIYLTYLYLTVVGGGGLCTISGVRCSWCHCEGRVKSWYPAAQATSNGCSCSISGYTFITTPSEHSSTLTIAVHSLRQPAPSESYTHTHTQPQSSLLVRAKDCNALSNRLVIIIIQVTFCTTLGNIVNTHKPTRHNHNRYENILTLICPLNPLP